jgi:hypothetical protein
MFALLVATFSSALADNGNALIAQCQSNAGYSSRQDFINDVKQIRKLGQNVIIKKSPKMKAFFDCVISNNNDSSSKVCHKKDLENYFSSIGLGVISGACCDCCSTKCNFDWAMFGVCSSCQTNQEEDCCSECEMPGPCHGKCPPSAVMHQGT